MFERLLAGPGRRLRDLECVAEGELPESPAQADAWLLTGSPHGVYDRLPFIAPLEQFTRDSVAMRRPLAGICFGHQLIAQALGGTVVKHPGGWRIGPQAYRIEGIAEPVRLHAWHQDQVTRRRPKAPRLLPPDLIARLPAWRSGTTVHQPCRPIPSSATG